MKSKKKLSKLAAKLPILPSIRESIWFSKELSILSMTGLPRALKNSLTNSQGETQSRDFIQSFGDVLLNTVDRLGPVYGKMLQTAFSRLDSGESDSIIRRLELDRLYGDWPPLAFEEICQILDRELPDWRLRFEISREPLGVASIAQVHGIRDVEGREWVIKIVKPQAKERLAETLNAVDELVQAVRLLAMTRSHKRMVRDLQEFVRSFRQEVDLSQERKTIEKLQQKWTPHRYSHLRIPKVYQGVQSSNILIIERFHGVPLSQVIADPDCLTKEQRQKLARKTLYELLVQVFEIGLFHGDPHAGNLILLEDGTVGLFDWGLAGELTESDRKIIAELLRSVLARDIDRLGRALAAMATKGNTKVSPEKVIKGLTGLKQRLQDQKTRKSLSLQQVLNQCFKAADKLGIEVPSGLFMMAKSLVTIEGLSRGIDPEVSLKKVAAPFLLKAARPGVKDLWNAGRAWILKV
jgi:ubiquinone biosynthesis protein